MKIKTLVGVLAASLALSAYAADAGKEASEAWKDTKEAAHSVVKAGEEAGKSAVHETEKLAKEAAHGTEHVAKEAGHGTEKAAESVAHGTKEAAHATAEKTEEAAHAAAEKTEEAADPVSKWIDSASDKLKGWLQKGSDNSQKYSKEIQEKLPEFKEQMKKSWKEAREQGKQASEAVSKWMDENLSKERIGEATKWMEDFKNGTQEKVIDPLVPHLLASRYPNSIDEWKDGYRRTYSVQMKDIEKPVDIQIPLSWAESANDNPNDSTLMTWTSDTGQGDLSVSLVQTPTGATLESVVIPFTKDRPEAKVEKVGDTQIRRVTYLAMDEKQNAYYFYAIPRHEKTIQVTAKIIRKDGETTEEVNKRLEENTEIFDVIAESLYQTHNY